MSEARASGSVVAPVTAQRELAPGYFRLSLGAPHIAATARPGQFVHLLPRSSWGLDPLLRRAFSVAAAHDGVIDVVYRVEGRGTTAMAQLRPGDSVSVIGPLGRPFSPLAPWSLLVGGGVGIPPLAMLASSGTEASSMVVLLGAKSAADLVCQDDFEALRVPVETATDDGSAGVHGFVTKLLAGHLGGPHSNPGPWHVYACGPWAMLRAVAALAQQHGVQCEVSLEECMPCGIGVCNGCVIPTVGAGDDYGRYRRLCIDGPVMAAETIDWTATGG